MSQLETAEVAAALTADILGEAVQTLAGDPGGDNAARMLAEMGQPVAAPQEHVVSSPTLAAEAALAPPAPPVDPPQAPPAAAEPEPDPEPFSFEPQIDDDYRILLEEPDYEAEAAAEIAAERDEQQYDDTFDADTAAQLRAKDKKIAWLEQQNVKANRGKWVAEAERSFPLLKTYAADEVREITATSRRGFAREAQKLNERFSKVLAPALADLQTAKALAKQEAERDARVLAAQQWGLPVTEAAGSPPPSSEQERLLLEARARRAPLEERLKILAGL